ncbi:MAG: hypothetical protein AVDCRST_MAG49-4110, partial [uncultured Thermomicrobiales bacterium]
WFVVSERPRPAGTARPAGRIGEPASGSTAIPRSDRWREHAPLP